MARGKEGMEALRRRYEAAMEHLDRLTEQLADEKIRRKEAEARAARLEGIDAMWKDAEIHNDQMLKEALDELHEQDVWMADHNKKVRAAFKEIRDRLLRDLKVPSDIGIDRVEFLVKRYPALMALFIRGEPRVNARYNRGPGDRKLNDDQLRRFQRLRGERMVVQGSDVDVGKAWADLLEGREAGFTWEEAQEYAGLAEEDHG